VVIAYNSILLSMLLHRHQNAEKEKFLELVKTISPVACQHIHFLGLPVSRQPPPDRLGGYFSACCVRLTY
jgi:hypothetical protein